MLVAGCGTKCNFLATSAVEVERFLDLSPSMRLLKVLSLNYSVCCLSKYCVFYANDEHTMH